VHWSIIPHNTLNAISSFISYKKIFRVLTLSVGLSVIEWSYDGGMSYTGALSYMGSLSYTGCEVDSTHFFSRSSFLSFLHVSIYFIGSNVEVGFVAFMTHWLV